MGDRISIKFINSAKSYYYPSPILFAHWAGEQLLDYAIEFYDLYKDKIRRDPSNWIYNFISWIGNGDVIDGSWYVFQNEELSTDNPTDNGYYMMDLADGSIKEYE